MGAIKKHPLNAPGKYWVACDYCLSHGCCEEAAPNNFSANSEGEYHWSYFVYKQPETEEEECQCREALLACPMAAIHDDGE